MFYIYTPDLVRLALIEGYSSMIWTRKYHAPGTFQLTIPYSSVCDNLAQENLIVYGNEAGIIESINIKHDDHGDTFTASGRFLAGYLDRRILWGTNSKTDTYENVMRHLVTQNCTVGDRAIENLSVAADTSLTGSTDYNGTNLNLLSEIMLLSEASGHGFRIKFETTGLTFEVYDGLDRSVDQAVNSRAIFSRSFENVLEQVFDASTIQTKNVTKVDCQYWEEVITESGTVRSNYTATRTVGTETGRDRRETFIDVGDITEKEDVIGARNETERNAVMDALGAVAYVQDIEAFTAKVDPKGNLVYKTDYDLGDIITVESREWGVRVNARITEVKEIYEGKGTEIELTLGYGIPDFKKQMRWLNG